MQIAESFSTIKQPSRLLDLVQLQSGLSDQSILTTLNLIRISQTQNWKPSDVKLSSELVERIGDEVYRSGTKSPGRLLSATDHTCKLFNLWSCPDASRIQLKAISTRYKTCA
ncbi:hypothetical protein PGTUg99_007299 [Puccinia graminis f. sp. tritici]|uniref:Uncharacterized protein n=1 Tax=Puccinia graminis f. sp. tritici TaxID=56615 RepID=A0A5B0QMD0_PUCGR|nr:hypothetical protein PGTUg99_007299 [Puccinia graminis f. sp. tritici]